MINGILSIKKEKGFTSHDVVAKLRGILHMKKIGHTGTLDPQAEGVLPVCLGNGTKLCALLTDHDKEYVTEMLLGVTTDTQDMTGQILTQTDLEEKLTTEMVEEAIHSFLGEYDQIPPMYSALKVNGKKLYELAREGKEVERKPRTVTIKKIEIEEIQLPVVKMKILCSKGTYIRTLCYDIGQKLGCGAAMKSLVRTRVGVFSLEDSLTLSEVEELARKEDFSFIHPVWEMFKDLKKLVVSDRFRPLAQNGNALRFGHVTPHTDANDGEEFCLYDTEGTFYGIYSWRKEKDAFCPVKMFLERKEN